MSTNNTELRTTSSGTFSSFTVEDNTNYGIEATIVYSDGTIPLTNKGNEYLSGQIKSGSKTIFSSKITGYRNSFYGTLTNYSELTSSLIRGLTGKSNKALVNNNSFTINIPIGAKRVIFAYPATLRDVSSVKDVNGMNAEIKSAFTKVIKSVEGANGYTPINYKVYYLDFANPNSSLNTYKVTI